MKASIESPGSAHWGALVSLLIITAAAAFIGSIASGDSAGFYQELARPVWAPPAWVFGPVWTALYMLMAIAAWLVVRALGRAGAARGLGLYGWQLVFNALWTWLFFRWRSGAGAFVDVVALLVAVAMMVRIFWRATPLAGALLVPYLAWVGFATALTYAVWRLNPSLL